MKITERRLKKVINQEAKRILEDVSIEDMTSNIKAVDEIRSKVDRLETRVSRQNFEGYLTRGGMKKVNRKVGEIRERLEDLQEIFINERAKKKGLD